MNIEVLLKDNNEYYLKREFPKKCFDWKFPFLIFMWRIVALNLTT